MSSLPPPADAAAGGGGARISPGTVLEIGRLNAIIARAAGLGLGARRPAIFTTLARNRALFRAWLRFAGRLMPGGTLARRETELMVLRTAHNCSSDYEWQAHAGLARGAGLSPEQVEQIREGGLGTGFSDHERLLLRAVDELHADRALSDATWKALRPKFDDDELIELCMLVGHYEMLAMTLNSLRVQPDLPRLERRRPVARALQWLAGRGRPAARRRARRFS